MKKRNLSNSNQSDLERAELRSHKGVLLLLFTVNVLMIFFIGLLIYKEDKRNSTNSLSDNIVNGIMRTNPLDTTNEGRLTGELVPLDTFLVNLSGNRGQQLIKLKMELEVNKGDVQKEIEQLRPKIRDIIIILISSKSYGEISSLVGKENLRNEIRDQVNLFLTKGRIQGVYFTQIIFS